MNFIYIYNIYVCMYMYFFKMYTFTYTQEYVYVGIHTHIITNVIITHTYIYMYIYIYIYITIYICIHIYVYTHIYIYIYTHWNLLVELPILSLKSSPRWICRITAAPEVPVGTNEGSVPANTALPYCAPGVGSFLDGMDVTMGMGTRSKMMETWRVSNWL